MEDQGVRLRAAGPADIAEISELSLAEFGPADGATPARAQRTISTWRETKTAIVVARDPDGRFLGYALGAPNTVNNFARSEGQVAVLTHVAVVPAARGLGVGTALVERAVKTLRMFGYSRIFAQIRANLVDWYDQRGWTVGPARQTKTWIEPFIPQDAAWHPDEFEPGEFSPILLLGHLEQYPHLAELTVGSDEPLAEAAFTVVPDGEESMQRAGEAIGLEIARHPGLAEQLPWALVAMLSENRRLPADARQLLADALKD
jgi:predicted N-acetyltransferase YhbS